MSSHSSPSLRGLLSNNRITFGLLPGLGIVIILRMAIHLYRPDIEDAENRVRDHPFEQLYDTYDFIIVGAGSAGSVLANRLSENPNWKVLLLEAGQDENVLSEVPVLFPVLQTSSIDWQFLTEPSDGYCLSMVDRKCKWPRGKVLGGSSVLNAMLYIRGNKRDYNNWERMGNSGWGYDSVLPYFLKSEDIRIPEHQNDPYHRTGGPLTVEYFAYEHPITRNILRAGEQFGYKIRDVNGEFQTGFTRSQATVRDGLRCSTAKAFLRPSSKRENLHVSVHSLVEKILIDEQNIAYGVMFRKHGQERIVKASKEVILSAGAIQSPQLLMLSGVGDADHLKDVGIHPIVNLVGVGRNLQDHIAMGGHSFLFDNPYKNGTPYCFNLPEVLTVASLVDFSVHKTGPLYSMMEAEAMAFVNTKYQDPSEDYPDIQLFIAPTADNLDGGWFGKRANGLTDDTYAALYEDILYESSFSIVPLLLRPKSRGYLKLRDANPNSPPMIYPNYFSDPQDIKVLVEGARIVQDIVNQPALRELNARPNPRRNPGCAGHELMSEEHLECQARHHSLTIYHPVGTCAMGPPEDPEAVVDSRLKVYGINGLRVVDGSIMPTIVSGNTNAPIIMIAEKAADMIKENWNEIILEPEPAYTIPEPVGQQTLTIENDEPTKIQLKTTPDLFNETKSIFPSLFNYPERKQEYDTETQIALRSYSTEKPLFTVLSQKTWPPNIPRRNSRVRPQNPLRNYLYGSRRRFNPYYPPNVPKYGTNYGLSRPLYPYPQLGDQFYKNFGPEPNPLQYYGGDGANYYGRGETKMSWACDPALTSNIVNSYQTVGPLFMQTLQTFFAAQCALVGDYLWPADAIDKVLEDPYYDFIVVGAGSAGSAVAHRLSEVPEWKVLLVEAGGNPTLNTEIPHLFYNNMRSPQDWAYKTQPQDGACRSYTAKGCAWPRGKALGGSSSINFMFYVRGNKADFDEWAADGNYGWSYDDVLPYFIKSEKFTGVYNEQNKKYHNWEGNLNVAVDKQSHDFEHMIINAAVELGLKNSSDINGESQMGVMTSQTTTKDGTRFSTARAFLNPIKDRKNFHVIKHAQATKVLFVPGTNIVSGVMIHKDGKDIVVNVKKELILSAGAINSPHILLLSGIGPRKHLEDMKIEVKADLPVGENLQDHLFVPTFYTKPGDKNYYSIETIVKNFAQYVLEGTGPLINTSPNRVISFVNTTDPESPASDMQFHYFVLPPGVYNVLDIFQKHGLNDEAYTKFKKMNEDKFTLVIFNTLLKPKSAGKILLASKNPFEAPLLFADYYKDPEDMATVIRAMKQHSLRLGDTKALKEAGFKLDWLDIDACKKFDKNSDDYLDCISRELTFSLYHPTSTAKMGPDGDETSVVDPELRVRKVKGLRVIDASIMPSVVRGNTNAPSIMIGEKGADMIKKFWLNKHTEL
ncbi:unnamed protein product [Spodoptera exigua]|nr:unnamed protein product [Spodoptera exigua]